MRVQGHIPWLNLHLSKNNKRVDNLQGGKDTHSDLLNLHVSEEKQKTRNLRLSLRQHVKGDKYGAYEMLLTRSVFLRHTAVLLALEVHFAAVAL